jgi:hypothetical protein
MGMHLVRRRNRRPHMVAMDMVNPKVERTRMVCPSCFRRVIARFASLRVGKPAPVRHYQPGYAFDDDGVPGRRRCPAGERAP